MPKRTSWFQVIVVACTGACLSIVMISSAVAEPYTVDTVHSTVLFRIKHLNTSHAWGRFNDVSGKVDLEGSNPSLEVQLKSASVDTANDKREQHLRSPDFLNVKQFPTISFKSTRVQPAGDGKYDVEGMLSLHGVSKPVKVQLARVGSGKNQMGANIVGYDTTFDIKRSDYGMKFLLEGLGDDVKLTISLECTGK
jgi:polyisoprenoid-binding protein YceI